MQHTGETYFAWKFHKKTKIDDHMSITAEKYVFVANTTVWGDMFKHTIRSQ